MDLISRSFQGVWDRTVGHLLILHRLKKLDQRRQAYYKHNNADLSAPRILFTRRNGHCPETRRNTPKQNQLLGLPSEIRLLIWEHAVGGKLIALYRDHGRLTHCVLDETNSRLPGTDIPLSVPAIENAVSLLPRPARKHNKIPKRPRKHQTLALLQSCRQIHSEAFDLLYSHNTFLFLQNQTVSDFYRCIFPQHFAALQSVHIHWQVREVIAGSIRWAWTPGQFLDTIKLTLRMPKLRHLSIFIQGPIKSKENYRTLLEHVDYVFAKLDPCPTLFVLRLPHPNKYQAGDMYIRGLKAIVSDPTRKYPIRQPPTDSPGDNADEDTGADFGWRQGVVFLPPNGGSDDFVMRSYLIWTPTPPGIKWPCMI